MSGSDAYRVVVTGEIPDDLSKADVVAAFARVFKVDHDKADLYFQGKPRLLRRNLDSARAESYTKVLTQIGVPFEVSLEQPDGDSNQLSTVSESAVRLDVAANETLPEQAEQPAAAEDAFSGLALVGETSSDDPVVATQSNAADRKAEQSMICPKCRTFQPRAEECASCGIVVAKYDPLVHAVDRSNEQSTPESDVHGSEEENASEPDAKSGIFASLSVLVGKFFNN